MFSMRKVANTDVSVTSVSLGGTSIGNLYVETTDAASQAVLDCAWDAGIRYFDTAPHYGRGLSEVRFGLFLKNRPRDEFVISTKVGRVLTPGEQKEKVDDFVRPLPNDVHYDYSAKGFEQSLDGSLQRLGLDRVDIVYVHDIGRVTHGDGNVAHMKDLLESGLPYLEKLKREGTIGAYGLGVNENEICVEIVKAHPIDVILIAGRWTLLDRTAEVELVPLCRQKGTTLVPGGVFNSGILATGARPGAYFNYQPASAEILGRVRRLQARCDAQGVDLPRAALQFCQSRPEVASVLLGTGKVSSLSRNLEALAEPLAPEVAENLFAPL